MVFDRGTQRLSAFSLVIKLAGFVARQRTFAIRTQDRCRHTEICELNHSIRVVTPRENISLWGFRMLDELDLTEFWSKCSLKTGWLFEVTAGGWKDLLVVGNDCVSVLSTDEPQLQNS